MEDKAIFTPASKEASINQPRASIAAGNREQDQIATANRRKEIQFKASHTLLIGFFLWIFSLHILGIYFFTNGFLLTRFVLDHQSSCTSPPIELERQDLGQPSQGCWHPNTFTKAVVIIIDALRYDFTVPYKGKPHHYHNALRVLHKTAVEQPQNAFLLPFIADPPTATLQRLKGLTTGTLPAFVELGSNFAGTAIKEDNLVAQLVAAGKNLVHLGDDTWHSLFPGYFDPNLTHAYDSFNVWDLHTVDNGVTEHLLPMLESEAVRKWDVIFGHYLGVDHAGHRYGPDHPAMEAKLNEMDDVLDKVIAALNDETLLVVMGDHGMDTKGDHGGESDDEVEAALWMYSKKGAFGRLRNDSILPPSTGKERPIAQIDLVPTLSLLLGLPIPYNNLGLPIAEAFAGTGQVAWENLATVNAITSGQINRYQRDYAIAQGLDDGVFQSALKLRERALQQWQVAATSKPKHEEFRLAFESMAVYQKETLRICKSLWARFDVSTMVEGIVILTFAVVIMGFFARSSALSTIDDLPAYLQHIGVYSVAGALLGATIKIVDPDLISANTVLLGIASGGILGLSLAAIAKGTSLRFSDIPVPTSVWGWLSVNFTILQAIGFASNSYTIWEDEILLFFISSFAIFAFVSSCRQESVTDRTLGATQSVLFLLLTRFASLSRLCREEQMPFCRSTYYASLNSSTSAPWQLSIPLLLAAFLPLIIKLYYARTLSYKGPATIWIGIALRLGMLAVATFWVLDAADDNNWLIVEKSLIRIIKMVLARLTLGLAFIAGTTYFIWSKPCISIEISSATTNGSAVECDSYKKTVIVAGYANMHGSRYFILVSNWIIAMTLMQKPMGAGAIGVLTVQILALLEIVDTNHLSQSAIGPVVLGLLGNFHFFKTGHQATLSSIQWESAFIPLSTIRYPWSPLLVTLNAFGAQILTAVAVPLVVIWKQPPKKSGLLSEVAKAMATFLMYHAVISLATTMWAGWLRRHLMLYRIFSPRFMTGAAVLVVVDLIGIVVAIGGIRCNIASVAEVFGWQ